MKKFASMMIIGLMAVSVAGAAEMMMKDPNKGAKDPMAQKMGITDAKMAEMMQLSSPGEQHKNLEPLVGSWTYVLRMWADAKAKPDESKGTSVNKWIMNGRFVQSDVKGTAMGQPFEGMNIVGYDNLKAEYQSSWIDNMATGMMTSRSAYDAATRTFNETGAYSCAMTGIKDRPFRGVLKLVDDKSHTYTMYHNGPDGKEYKAMEITYNRAQ